MNGFVKDILCSVAIGLVGDAVRQIIKSIISSPVESTEKSRGYKPNGGVIAAITILSLAIFFVKSLFDLIQNKIHMETYLAVGLAVLIVTAFPALLICIGTGWGRAFSGKKKSIREQILIMAEGVFIGISVSFSVAMPISIAIYLYMEKGWNIGSIIFVTIIEYVILIFLNVGLIEPYSNGD